MSAEAPTAPAPTLRQRITRLALAGMGILLLAILFVAGSWWYTIWRLERAAQAGIYATPTAGMQALIEQNWRDIQKVEIEYAGPNRHDGQDPHVGFVIAKVWAGSRSDGTPVGSKGEDYDYPGTFFVHIQQGWVWVPEGDNPEFMGLWMKVFGLAGQ